MFRSSYHVFWYPLAGHFPVDTSTGLARKTKLQWGSSHFINILPLAHPDSRTTSKAKRQQGRPGTDDRVYFPVSITQCLFLVCSLSDLMGWLIESELISGFSRACVIAPM